MPAKRLREFGNTLSGLTAHLDAPQVQAAIFVKLRLDRSGSEVFLIYNDQRIKILERGTGPVAVHEKPIRFRFGSRDDGQSVDIGRHRLGAPTRVDSLD